MILKLTSKNRKGFTLVELLVVIAIIAILATIILASVGSYREKSRDSRRLNDLRQIVPALELYYNENNQYPGTDNTESWGDDVTAGTLVYELQGVGGGGAFMSLVPSDPGSMTYFYYPGSSNQTYIIGVDEIENENNQTILGNDVDNDDISGIVVPAGRCNDPEYCIQY